MRTHRNESCPVPWLESDIRLVTLRTNDKAEPSEEPLHEVRKALEEALRVIQGALKS